MSENIEYLNLLERKLDDQQLKACCSEGNTVVAAGAGSGKTQVLATRFAYLVMTKKIAADRILTLTFTKKAASEMYERIHDTLEFFAGNPKTPDAEKKLAEEALKIFSRAHIQTLDSYCAAILKQCASRYGITPDFGQASAGEIVNSLAFPFILKHKNDKAVHDFVDFSNGGDLQSVASNFASEIIERTSLKSEDDYFTKFLEAKKEGVLNEFEKNLSKLYSQIDSFNAEYDLRPMKSQGAFAAKNEIDRLFEILEELPSDFELLHEDGYAALEKNLGSIKLQLPRDKASEYLKEIIKIIRGDDDSEYPLGKLIQCASFMKDFSKQMRKAELQNEFLQEVNHQKRTSGSLSFRDISEMALKALVDFDDIRHQEQNAYDRIMIDEFQDNNKANRDLLFLISSANDVTPEESLDKAKILPDKLFFVGDDKQSIYKFRDADVSVFKKLSEDLKTEPIPMVYNYRSTQELLDSFNQIFGGFRPAEKSEKGKPVHEEVEDEEQYIFPRKAENDFEAEFTQKTIAEKNPLIPLEKNNFKKPSVHVCMYNEKILSCEEGYTEEDLKDRFMTPKDQKAIYVAKEIKRRIAESEQLFEEGKINSPLHFSDFAILDKSRGERSYLKKYLLQEGIPFNLDQQNDLFSEASVNDIYYLLRLCVYPEDTFALSVFLHSPFACLNEQTVENILGGAYISDEERERYEKAMKFYEEIKERVFRDPLSKTITDLWYSYGYRYETLWHKNLYLSSESYDILFELARQSDEAGQTVSEFIDSLDNLRESSKDEDLDLENLSYPKESADEVQIMTIHKSKGLQFPIVFVYGITGSFRKDRDDSDEKQTKETPFGESKEESDAKSDAEFRRVIYVALTRAEKEAYVVGSWYHPDSSLFQIITRKYYPDAMETPMTGETVFEEGAPFDFVSIKAVERKELSHSVPEAEEKFDFVCNLGREYKNVEVIETEEIERNVISPSSLELSYEESLDSKIDAKALYPNLTPLLKKLDLMKFGANDFGTLAHAFMESFVKQDENINKNPSLYGSLYDYNLSSEENMAKKEISEMREICSDMVKNFEKTEFGNEIRSAKKVKAEQGFIASICENTVNGVIDLAYQKEDGSVVIVDYKTDEEILPKKYFEQIKCYKEAASSLFGVGKEKITTWLYYLRYGKAVEVN